jgi:chemotaxis protein MotB
MAFFMVMWLVTAVSKDKRAALFEYFKNPSMEQGRSVKPAPGANGPGGASTSPINLGGGLDAPKAQLDSPPGAGSPDAINAPSKGPSEREIEEKRQLESLEQDLRAAIEQSQALKPFKDQLLLDITPEGLRIQIVDAQNRAMFDLGSADLKGYTEQILRELAPYLNSVPNRLSITGHTDTTPYVGAGGHTNWELSSERANSARRALTSAGLKEDKVARVVGLASSVLFDKDNPRNPINRRISMIVMTRAAEDAARATDAPEMKPKASGGATAGGAEPGAAAAVTAGAG